MFWRLSAIWDMPAAAAGRPWRAFGMRYDSPFPLVETRPPPPISNLPPQFLPASFFFISSANGIIALSNMAIWNSTSRVRPGWYATKTRAFKGWRNVFWIRT